MSSRWVIQLPCIIFIMPQAATKVYSTSHQPKVACKVNQNVSVVSALGNEEEKMTWGSADAKAVRRSIRWITSRMRSLLAFLISPVECTVLSSKRRKGRCSGTKPSIQRKSCKVMHGLAEHVLWASWKGSVLNGHTYKHNYLDRFWQGRKAEACPAPWSSISQPHIVGVAWVKAWCCCINWLNPACFL